MAGTKAGGLKARDTNLKRQGSDFYSRIGRIGGQNGHTGGFAANPDLAKEAGRKGGLVSRRNRDKKQVQSLSVRRELAEARIKNDNFDTI